MCQCSLCGREILDHIESRFCVYCNSTFHRSCITEHFYHNKYCPACKERMSLLSMCYGLPSEHVMNKKPISREVTRIKVSTFDTIVSTRLSKKADFTEELNSNMPGKKIKIKCKKKKRPLGLAITAMSWLFLALLRLFLSAIEFLMHVSYIDRFPLILFFLTNFWALLLIAAGYELWKGKAKSLDSIPIVVIVYFLCYFQYYPIHNLGYWVILFLLSILVLIIVPWVCLTKPEIKEYFGTDEKDNNDKTYHGSSPPTNLVQEIMRDLDSDYQRFK